MTSADLLAAGYYASTGLPMGQVEDYRRAMPDGKGIHMRGYPNGRLTAHWDRVDPSVNFAAHMIQDAPLAGIVMVAAGAVLATGLGIWKQSHLAAANSG